MMYMAGDYSPELPWEMNLKEMEDAAQSPGTNIIALVDPLGPNNTMLLRVEHFPPPIASIQSPHISGSGLFPEGGDANMASGQTLEQFVEYSATTYPADNLVLFLWGHGAEWVGLCPDGSDLMFLPELGAALRNATASIGRPLDMTVVDACAEANFEMLYEIEGYTRYFAASEMNIPSTGLPYTTILNYLDQNKDIHVSALGDKIVKSYVDWARFNSTYSASMALFNMSKMGTMSRTLDELSVQGVKYDSIFHSEIHGAFNTSEHYGSDWGLDFGDLMSKLFNSNVPLEVKKTVLDATLAYLDIRTSVSVYDNPLPDDSIHVKRGTGAVIYASTSGFADSMYGELKIGSSPWHLFGRLGRHVGGTNFSALGPTLAYSDGNGDGQPDSVTLTWPQQYQSSEVWVFREEPGGGLIFLDNVSSIGSQIAYSGTAGYLSISASVSNDSIAMSHTSVKVALFGSTKVTVRTTLDGAALERNLQVKLTIRNSTIVGVATGGKAIFNLTIPTQVSAGEMVIVEVVDPKSGTVVGDGLVIVGPQESDVSISVAYPSRQSTYPGDLVFMALLPGLLILVYDLLLYVEDRKKKK